MGWSRVAVLFDNTPHGRASADALRGELGGEVLFQPLYTVEALGSFRPIVEAVIRRDVDVVVLVVGERNAGELAPLFHAENPGLPLLGDRWADLPSDTLLRGSYRIEADMSGPDGSLNDQAFVSRFRAHFGHDPDAYAAYGHDAVTIAARAAAEEGPGRASIRRGLARLDGACPYQGVTGPLAFDSTGARHDRSLSVWEVCLDDSIRRPGSCR
jgi:branched-chain amino acid transport system substrate-binding protein